MVSAMRCQPSVPSVSEPPLLPRQHTPDYMGRAIAISKKCENICQTQSPPFPTPQPPPPENLIVIQFCPVCDFTVPAFCLQMPRENKSFVPIGACSNSSNLPTDKTSTSCLFCPQTVEREEKFADNVGIQHRLRSICAVLKGAGKWQVCAGKVSTPVGEPDNFTGVGTRWVQPSTDCPA